ncbi:hypothetical protein [Bdellovibrio reynosensis]|uniref:Uncharacterized protein n=1 Tax=Bdellovibrio reynosensis TaxID=2835041 RepID=A0ABY4C4T7_9BACT|nr:hypothetical protein [Bdellovibrio reynosensis]UOE99867.1 hypothetical protein MNR06_09175 [Bdellovibrio reynosensis]
MNIKGLISNILPNNDVRGVDRTGKAIQSDMTHDRDANGQETYSGNQEHRDPMTEEQLEKAMEHLRNLPATKEHKWTIELDDLAADGRFVIVRDNLGNVIRRIPELELWTLPSDAQSPRGQLLKRSA